MSSGFFSVAGIVAMVKLSDLGVRKWSWWDWWGDAYLLVIGVTQRRMILVRLICLF